MKRLAVFARRPVAGMVKTRLSPALPAPLAARLYAALLADTLFAARASSADECSLWLADEVPAGEAPPALGLARRVQLGETLGDRLEHAFAHLLAREGDVAVVLGSDAPAVTAADLDAAFAALADHDAVIGPASDGGYWLVGLSRPAPELFRGVPWSTGEACATTLEHAARLGLRVASLRVLSDLDTPADLARLAGECARGPGACGEHARDALRAMGLLA